MKVHIVTSRSTLVNDIAMLRKMLATIKDSGHTIARDWIDQEYAKLQGKEASAESADWFEIYKENLGAVTKSDVVIAETSYENFGVGYLIAYAVQLKKPVLLLRHQTADKNAFATGVEDDWVKRKDYTEESLSDILNQFLEENRIDTKDMRFNFFIDRPIYNYLRWAAYKTGKTKAEILRELVSREIDKSNDVIV